MKKILKLLLILLLAIFMLLLFYIFTHTVTKHVIVTSIDFVDSNILINIDSEDEVDEESLEYIEVPEYITASMDSKDLYPDGWLEDFNKKLVELQQKFPNGSYWNHAGDSDLGYLGATDIPCNHTMDGELNCNSYKGKTDALYPVLATSVQCRGFGNLLSDLVFGEDATATKFYNYDDLRIGDIARISNGTHTVFIIDKTDKYVIVAECNSDYCTCKIRWGRKILKRNLKGWYITRWQ